MKRIYTSLLTVLLSTFLCNAQESTIFKNGKVIICGHSDVHKNELQTIAIDIGGITDMRGLNYVDFINNETGNYKFKIDISNAQDVSLEYNNKKLTVFVSPGDSLFISFDKLFDTCQQSDIFNHITFSGQYADINKTILEYQVFKGDSSFIPNCKGKSAEQYKAELSNWIDNRAKKIAQFAKLKNSSKEFVDWATFDNIYSNANYLIDYMAYLSMNKMHLVGNLFDTSIFPVNNEKALISRQYRVHVNQYFVFKYFMDSTVQSLISKKEYYLGFKKALNSIIANEPNGISRDILVNDLFNSCLSEDQMSCQKLKNENISCISDRYLRSEFEKHFNSVINQPKSIEFISSSNSEDSIIGDLFKDIEARFKGRVIYLDIWATWCSPCRYEFPYSHKLSDLYKGKNIEFIYVCMNSSKENWENVRKMMKLDGSHYYLNKIQSDVFSTKFRTRGFPTYYLINKKGQLIDKNAPRPSSTNIKDQIDILLNEQ